MGRDHGLDLLLVERGSALGESTFTLLLLVHGVGSGPNEGQDDGEEDEAVGHAEDDDSEEHAEPDDEDVG